MSNDSFTNFYLLTFLFLFSFKTINCQRELDISNSYCCCNENYLTDERCFNNVLKLENYQVNHFAKNNNGDFVVEFTKFTENNEISSSRKFYGLKKGGEYFFQDGSDHLREITKIMLKKMKIRILILMVRKLYLYI